MTIETTRALTRSEMALQDLDNYHERESYELSARDHDAICRALSYYNSYLDRMARDLKRIGVPFPPALARVKLDADELHSRILRSGRVIIEPEE